MVDSCAENKPSEAPGGPEMARRRGGNRPPEKPAAVSGPGRLSQRTDGAVPQLAYSGLAYGENKAVNDQQASAPISSPGAATVGGGGTPPSAAASVRGGPPRFGDGGAFSPTNRPGEPLTAGTDWGAGPGAPPQGLPDDPYVVAKALYAISPTPELERLVARLSRA